MKRGLLCGLQKFSVDMTRRRASSPKSQLYNNALKMVYTFIVGDGGISAENFLSMDVRSCFEFCSIHHFSRSNV